MDHQKFGWCFIGTGTLARQVAEQITASGRHRVASVCSRRFEKAKEFAEKWGAEAFESARDAVCAEGVDAVYVVTPHPSHYEMAKLALSLGKPVLCEKPFTMTAAEARELFRLAAEKQVYLAEAMWTWFAPVANRVKSWLEAGKVGEVEEVKTNFLVNVVHYAPRLTDPALAGGALLDSTVYPVTYLYRLFGRPEKVRCTAVISGGVDLKDEIDLTFASGKTFHISAAIDAENPDESIRIIGEKGEIFADRFHYTNRAEWTGKDGSREVFEGETSMLNEFDRVAEEIRQGRKTSAFVPPEATEEVMDILDECRRQIGLIYPFETSLP